MNTEKINRTGRSEEQGVKYRQVPDSEDCGGNNTQDRAQSNQDEERAVILYDGIRDLKRLKVVMVIECPYAGHDHDGVGKQKARDKGA